MKKVTLILGLISFGVFAHAQKEEIGLEKLIVEKYYVSNAADANESIGVLPVGSVTYRLYVDMKPGYIFQVLYGSEYVNPVTGDTVIHRLSLTTSTKFFNNEDRGATTANAIASNQLKNNTVALDSWFSVGAAATGQIGVLKKEDNGAANLIAANTILKNTDLSAGIPLTSQDGIIAGTPEVITFVGLTTELDVFDATSQAGNSFVTKNGIISCQNGSKGLDSTNKVLIGQFTTDGEFCYELNIQMRRESDNKIFGFVYENPYNDSTASAITPYEIKLPFLKGCVGGTTGIHSVNSFTPSFTIYPNPVSSALTMQISQSNQNNSNGYTIYGADGKIIFHKKLGAVVEKQLEKIDMSVFPCGVYILELSIDGATAHKKIIKNY